MLQGSSLVAAYLPPLSRSRTSGVLRRSRYWSNQQVETLPVCRVSPRNARDVPATLLVTSFFQCQFAVKSGGHAAFAGASHIQNGITIDLVKLRQVKVSEDRALTRVGAGNRWLDVYSKLDKQDLSVVGGWVADIGIGGLTLGGEYSNSLDKEPMING